VHPLIYFVAKVGIQILFCKNSFEVKKSSADAPEDNFEDFVF